MKLKLLLLMVLFFMLILMASKIYRSSQQTKGHSLAFENNIRAISSVLIFIYSVEALAYNEIYTYLSGEVKYAPVDQFLNEKFLKNYLKKEDIVVSLNFKNNFMDPWGNPYQFKISDSGNLLIISSGPNQVLGDHDDMVARTGFSGRIERDRRQPLHIDIR